MSNKKTIDARGLFCPGPLQILKGMIKRIEKGERLELLGDDPDSISEIMNWCKNEGHVLESITEGEEGISFLVLKN